MYNYGLGQSWTEDALPEVFPTSGESGGGTADEGSMEIPAGPVPDAPDIVGTLDRFKTPMGLGALGALAGFLFAKSKKKRITNALVGGAAGYAASFFIK